MPWGWVRSRSVGYASQHILLGGLISREQPTPNWAPCGGRRSICRYSTCLWTQAPSKSCSLLPWSLQPMDYNHWPWWWLSKQLAGGHLGCSLQSDVHMYVNSIFKRQMKAICYGVGLIFQKTVECITWYCTIKFGSYTLNPISVHLLQGEHHLGKISW